MIVFKLCPAFSMGKIINKLVKKSGDKALSVMYIEVEMLDEYEKKFDEARE